MIAGIFIGIYIAGLVLCLLIYVQEQNLTPRQHLSFLLESFFWPLVLGSFFLDEIRGVDEQPTD